MSEYNSKYKKSAEPFDSPYGNLTSKKFELETNSSGVAINISDASPSALTSGDTVILGLLPKGLELIDCLGICEDVGVASSTLAVGFKYTDGVDDSDVPQDADYFFAAFSLNAANRTRANNTAVKSVTLPKDAWLYVTHSAHTQNVALHAEFHVIGRLHGPA